jgi:hypothetical protein
MRETMVGLLEKTDRAVAACAGVVPETVLEPVARSTRDLRVRLSYPEDLLVAALVGGTGSGKSSLLNAVVGAEVALVGGVRPTTLEPLAVVPRARAEVIAGYLDDLGVRHREPQEAADWLCLLDLPDTDSVDVQHRLQVEALLPRLDVVVWVVDPEKYRDAALHHRYLVPLAPFSRQFVFVLNQVDRLSEESVWTVAGHFVEALAADGIESPRVIPVAASPAAGPPIGIDDLLGELQLRLADRVGIYDRLLTDLRQTASTLLESTGGRGVDFEGRAEEALRGAGEALAEEDEAEAVSRLTAFLEAIAGEVGDVTADRLRELAASVPVQVHEALSRVGPLPRPPRRRLRRAGQPTPAERQAHVASLRASLEEEILTPVRDELRRRAEAIASVAELSLTVSGLGPENLR